jgi:dynein heavy chain
MIVRNNGILSVNFDPKVVALLREVHYLGSLSMKAPPTADTVHSKSETYRKFIFQLENISTMYNNIQTNMLTVEKPLLKDRMDAIDREIEKGIQQLNWKSAETEDYVQSLSNAVGSLNSTLNAMKNNVSQIQKALKGWAASPFLERKDNKKVLNLEEKEVRFEAIFNLMRKDGQLITELIEQTRNLLNVEAGHADWVAYLNYVDQMVKDGFITAIRGSLNYLLDSMGRTQSTDLGPFLDAKLELENDALMFTPDMSEESEVSLFQIIKDILESIYTTSTLLNRISPNALYVAPVHTPTEGEEDKLSVQSTEEQKAKDELASKTYLGEILSSQELQHLRMEVLERVQLVAEECLHYKENFEQYSYLWTENRNDYMKKLTEVNGEHETNEIDKFESEIKKFENIHKSIMALEPEVVFNGWYRVDIRPLKQSLNVVTKKWTYTLTKHLSDNVINTLEEFPL